MAFGDTLARAVLAISADASEYFSNIGKVRKDLKSMGGDLTAAGKSFLPVTAALAGFGLAAVQSSQMVDDALDTIRLKSGATGDVLEGLEGSFRNVFKNVPDDAGRVADALSGVHQRTGLTGAGLEALTTRMLTFSRVSKQDINETVQQSTRVFGDWSIASDKQGDALDLVFRASQQTGVGVGDLMSKIVDSGPKLRQFGFSFEESAALLGKWEREGVNADAMLGGLGKAAKLFTEKNIPLREGLESTVAELQRLGPGVAANTLALETFGKTGTELVEPLRRGALSVDDLVKSIANGSDTIMDAAADTDGFAESWEKVKHNVVLALEPIGVRLVAVFNSLMPLLIAGAGKLASFGEWFSKLPDPVIKVVLAIGGLLAALGPLLIVFGTIASGLSSIIGLFAGGGAAATALGTAFTVLTGPIGWVLAAIVGLGAVWMKWGDDITRVVTGAYQAVKAWLWDKLEPVLTPIIALVRAIADEWVMFGRLVGAASSVAGGYIADMVSGIVGWLQGKLAPVFEFIGAVIELHVKVFQWMWEQISTIVPKVYAAVKTWLLDKFTGVIDGVRSGVEAVTGFFGKMYSKITGHLPEQAKMTAAVVATTVALTSAGPAAAEAAAQIDKHGRAASASAPNVKQLTKEQEAYNKSIADGAAKLSGLKMAEEIKKLDATMTAAKNGAGILKSEIPGLVDQFVKWQVAGGKLTPQMLEMLDKNRGLPGLVDQIDKYIVAGEDVGPVLADIWLKQQKFNAEISKTPGDLSKIIDAAPKAGASLKKLIEPLENIQPVDIAKVLNFGKVTPEQINVKAPGEMFKAEFGRNIGSFMQNDFPTTIMSAITGGGNVFEAAGSSIGGFLTSSKGFGTKLTSGLTSVFGKGLGGAFASLMPGIGTMMGPLLGKIGDAITKVFSGNTTKKAREEFATSMGMTLDGLYSKLQSMGAKGQQLANTALNIIGKHDEAGNKKWMSEVSAFLDETQKKEEELAAAAAEAFTKAQDAIGGALGKVITENIKSQDEFDRLSRIGLNTFNTLVASGVAPVEAMQRVGGAVDVLIASLEDSGLKGNAAFDQLKRWRTLTTENAPLLDQIGGLNELMEMTTTLGGMNADVFADMAAQGLDAYRKLVAAGYTESEARAQIKPLLEEEIRLNKEKGYAIDDATQQIIAQGIANGDLKIEAESMSDVFREGISALILAIGGELPEAWTKAAAAAATGGASFTDRFARPAVEAVATVSGALSGLASDFASGFDFPVNFNVGADGVGAIPMAKGGFGTVSEPTLFLAGEAGPEQWAFSGAGRRFSDGGSEAAAKYMAAISSKLDRLGDVVVNAEIMIDPDKLDRRVVRVSRAAHARGEIPVRADSVRTRVPNG